MNTDAVVLYAEDDVNDVMLMQRAFAKAGAGERLRVVPDGKEAIAYLQGKGKYADRSEYPLPVLLLIDLKMPSKSGFEVLKWVRNHPELEMLPTVVLTSSESDPDIKRAYELGVNSYLIKPPTLAKITALAENLDRYWLNLNRVPTRTD